MSRKQMRIWSLVLVIQVLFFAAIFGTKGFTSVHNKNWLDSLAFLVFGPLGIIGGTLGERIPHGTAGRSIWVYSLVFIGSIPVSWVYARILVGLTGLLGRQKRDQNKEPRRRGRTRLSSTFGFKMRKMTKQEWIVVGIAGTIVAGAYLVLTFPFGRHREPGIPRHRIDMQCIQVALLTYRNEFRHWPNGDTGEILRALRGENARQIKFLEVMDKDSGSMPDAWGTPYRIEIRSNTITVTSAGPNRTWYDKDDLEMERTEPPSAGDVANRAAPVK